MNRIGLGFATTLFIFAVITWVHYQPDNVAAGWFTPWLSGGSTSSSTTPTAKGWIAGDFLACALPFMFTAALVFWRDVPLRASAVVGGLIALAAIVFYPYDLRVGLIKGGNVLGRPLSELFTSSGSVAVPPGYAAITTGPAALAASTPSAQAVPPRTAYTGSGAATVQKVAVTLHPSRGTPTTYEDRYGKRYPASEVREWFRSGEAVSIRCDVPGTTLRVKEFYLPPDTNWTVTVHEVSGGAYTYDVSYDQGQEVWKPRGHSSNDVGLERCKYITFTTNSREAVEVPFVLINFAQ